MKPAILTVGAILVNAEGKILIQQRDEKSGLKYPGYWTTFGGKVEDGEHPDEAMRRELLEEIELEPELRLWKTRQFTEQRNGGSIIVEQWLYLGRLDVPADEITLNEGQALGFFDSAGLESLRIAFGLKAVFEEFFHSRWNGQFDDGKVEVVSAILVNPQNQVLLQQRDEKPDLSYGGYWALFGGRVEADEEPEQAMRRELKEELDLDVPVICWKVYERFEPGKSLNVTQYIYIGQLDKDITQLTLNEGQDMRLVAQSQIEALRIAFGFDTILKAFFAEQEDLV